MKTSNCPRLVLAILLALPMTVHAAGYLGAGGNRVSIDDSDFDDDDTTYSASLGLMFNPHVGIEFGYYDLGEFSGGAGEVDNDAWTGSLVLALPFDRSSIYGKLGVARRETSGSLFGIPVDRDDTENFYGAGAVFGLGPVGLYVEWLQFDGDRDVDVIGAGVRLLF